MRARFETNMARHPRVVWAKVRARLEATPDSLWSVAEMERTGGESDVVGARWANSSGWIARRKVRQAAAACVATAKVG